jgi:hypothetical protein
MRCFALTLIVAFVPVMAVHADAADLAFKPAGEGRHEFNTGVLRGTLRADGTSQGIPTLVHVPSGVDLASGGGNPGIFSFYRILATDHRYGDSPRHWPAQNKLLPDGAVEIRWPPAEEHPFELRAVYRFAAADTLDVETICTPQRAMPGAEVFLSSYFCDGFETSVHAAGAMYSQTKPGFVSADFCPLIDGTYLFFPRDREASRMIFDRRWELPPNPVQWSVTRRFAAPMALRHDKKSGLSILLMSPKEDCFAIAVSYNREPPDGVGSHRSIYFSLFGRDLKPGETARARTRLIVGRDLASKAEELYGRYESP